MKKRKIKIFTNKKIKNLIKYFKLFMKNNQKIILGTENKNPFNDVEIEHPIYHAFLLNFLRFSLICLLFL